MNEKRDLGVYLEDILESIGRIEKYAKNINREALGENSDIQDAIAYRLEVIGEAAKHIPREIRDKYPQIPWQEVARTRDKIIHHHFELDLNEIWDIIQHDLVPLKEQIKVVLEELDNHT